MHTTQNAQHNVTRIGANLSKHCPSISGLQLLLPIVTSSFTHQTLISRNFFVAYHLAIWGDYLDLDTQNIQEVSSIWC